MAPQARILEAQTTLSTKDREGRSCFLSSAVKVMGFFNSKYSQL